MKIIATAVAVTAGAMFALAVWGRLRQIEDTRYAYIVAEAGDHDRSQSGSHL